MIAGHITEKDLWKQYEKFVFRLIKSIPNSCVKFHPTIQGRHFDFSISVPVSIPFSKYFQAEYPLTIGGECKHYGRPVDVKEVDSFYGMLKHARLSLGILIAQSGFSEGAEERAREAGILLLRFPWELKILLDKDNKEYDDICHNCPCEDDDHGPGFIHWEFSNNHSDEFGYVKGMCQSCGTVFTLCFDCWGKTGFMEGDYDEGIECQGSCGAVFVPSYGKDKASMHNTEIQAFNSLEVEVLKSCYKHSGGLDLKSISKNIDGTKWKYWTIGDPLIFIREEGLVNTANSGLLKLTSKGKKTVERYILKAHAACYEY